VKDKLPPLVQGWEADRRGQRPRHFKRAYAKCPRGHKASKTDLRREALTIALGNTLKSVFADKEEASAKRDEKRRRDKEEHMQSFADIQRKTLEIQ
jgi:hypothetical protein